MTETEPAGADGATAESMSTTEHVALDDLDGTPHAVAFPDGEPRTIRLSLAADESVPEHDHPDREIVVYLVEGRVRITIDGETHVVEAGDLVRFDGDQPISPTAETDATALIVLAPRSDG